MTTLEKIYKELSERFKDEPNKNLILDYTMGVLEKNKAALVEETVRVLSKTFTNNQSDSIKSAGERKFKMEVIFKINGDVSVDQFKNNIMRKIDDFTLYNDNTDNETIVEVFDYWNSAVVEEIN